MTILGGFKGDFTITTTAEDMVVPTEPVEEHRLSLSNLDLLLPPLDASMFFCYKHNNDDSMTFKEKVSVLKKALAQTLAYFYPLAGEVVKNSAGEPEFLCNNRGAEFTEAFADIEFCELNLYNPDQSVGGKLVPVKKAGLVAIQVTELKCGTTIVACTMDHQVADAYSANMFWLLWAEIASSKPISLFPSFQRSLIKPRQTLKHDPLLDEMYLPISCLPLSSRSQDDNEPKKPQTMEKMVSRIYHISADQLCDLQSMASNGGICRRSKLQSFCGFLWKLVASYACQSGAQNETKITKMGIVVDGRSRLGEGESEEKKEKLASYFGNVLSIPSGQQTCGNLKDMPLSCVVEMVQNFLQPAVTKDHFLGLINWVEAHRPEPSMAQIYWVKDEDGPAFVVSSGQRSPISVLDFGWGKPVFGSCHFPWGGKCGYVMPMASPSENGDWVVYIYLSENQLDYIEAKAQNVFRPFSMELVSSK